MFAVNPGPDGSNDSFAVFQAGALAIGSQLASSATPSATSQPTKSTGSVSGGGLSTSTSTSTSNSNGEISLNIDAAMLMAAFGTVVRLIA